MVFGQSIESDSLGDPEIFRRQKGSDSAQTTVHTPPVEEDLSLPLAIDTFVGGSTPLDSFIETMIHWTAGKIGSAPIIAAKEDFFIKAGKVFIDDENYHQRMHYFLNSFLFEKPIGEEGNGTPFMSFRENSPLPCLIDGYIHSLFKILKIKPDLLVVKDLLADRKLRIQKQEGETFGGLTKGDLFQGFLIQHASSIFLSRGLIFHPPEAHKVIQRNIKLSKGAGKDLLLSQLARQQLKHRRLKHVHPKIVYSENTP